MGSTVGVVGCAGWAGCCWVGCCVGAAGAAGIDGVTLEAASAPFEAAAVPCAAAAWPAEALAAVWA